MFSNYDIIKEILINYPLYRQRSGEEVFLGIKKSNNKKWLGFKIIKTLKRTKEFPDKVVESGLYELGIFYWCLYFNNKEFNEANFKKLLDKNYRI